jgi:TRAP-type C4-dicarboxylate transport system permease small subunit
MNKNETEFGNTLYLGRILTVVYRIEDGILAAVLTLMIALAVVQILLRNFFGAGFIWGDMLVRILVLWIGLIGAMIATRQNKHIVFVHAEYYDGGRAFGQVPVWVCEAIMPLAFAVMALRYFMMSLMRFQAVFRPNNGEEPNRRN